MSHTNKSITNENLPAHTQQSEIGYPVQVHYIELSQMYMHRVHWHWHGEIEVIIISQGRAELLTDDKQIKLETGHGILVNQNIMHAVRPVDEEADCSLYSVVFHPSFLFGFGNTLMSSKFLVPFISSPDMKIIHLDKQYSWQEIILDLINNIIAVNLTKKYGYELLTKACLCQLWITLLEYVIPQNTTKSNQITVSLDEARVKQAMTYIEEHYAEHITLEQLANSVHISKSECCRCFKRTLQMTPIEYLMKYRIFKASNMIQSNDPSARSMSDLAFHVGFNNTSYFNKVFKQFLNCTPSEYKRNMKKDPAV